MNCKDGRDTTTTIRINSGLKAAFQEAAGDMGQTDAIIEAMRDWVAKNRPDVGEKYPEFFEVGHAI
jgi:hypothetical protein